MTTKKMMNSVESAVDDMLLGTVASNPGLAKLENHRVVLRSDLAESLPNRVAVMCGGGSGHEPAFAGYVGDGMLHAAVAGSVFASPPATQILAAILALAAHRPSGILVVVINYTGDRVNFGLAVERARALIEIPIEIVTIGEDTALTSSDRSAGRRGLAGCVLLLKMIGAMSKCGKSLHEIVSMCNEEILPNIGTIGVCLRPCIVPGNKTVSFNLGDSEMEVGLGVHGEAGVERTSLKTSLETVKIMFARMTQKDSATRLPLNAGDEVCLLLNNLGAVSELEMGILVKDAIKELTETYSVKVVRLFSGRFMTSLEMAGFSLSILKVTSNYLLELIDMDARTAGWSGCSFIRKIGPVIFVPDPLKNEKYILQRKLGPESDPKVREDVKRAVESVCDALIAAEAELNQMDTGCGDADCGSTMSRGARKLKILLSETEEKMTRYPAFLLRTAGQVSETEMGGSSGGMFSIFFETAATKIELESELTKNIVADALELGLAALQRYGRAQLGDRTLVDSLHPAIQVLKQLSGESSLSDSLSKAAAAASKAAASTKDMKASAGRASYVNQAELKLPDPGAHAIAVIFQALADAFM